MTLKTLANDTVKEIARTIPNSLTEADTAEISRVIEKALVEAVSHSVQNCKAAAVVCCGPEADLAHKIAEEVNRAEDLLITNLMSMR